MAQLRVKGERTWGLLFEAIEMYRREYPALPRKSDKVSKHLKINWKQLSAMHQTLDTEEYGESIGSFRKKILEMNHIPKQWKSDLNKLTTKKLNDACILLLAYRKGLVTFN